MPLSFRTMHHNVFNDAGELFFFSSCRFIYYSYCSFFFYCYLTYFFLCFSPYYTSSIFWMLLQVGGCLILECWAIIYMVFGVPTAGREDYYCFKLKILIKILLGVKKNFFSSRSSVKGIVHPKVSPTIVMEHENEHAIVPQAHMNATLVRGLEWTLWIRISVTGQICIRQQGIRLCLLQLSMYSP